MTDLLVKSLRQFYLARDSGVKWAIRREKASSRQVPSLFTDAPAKKINGPILTGR
jgi:hypothetical protein